MPLTDVAIRSAKPEDKDYRLADKTVAKYASFLSVQILEMFSSVFLRIFH